MQHRLAMPRGALPAKPLHETRPGAWCADWSWRYTVSRTCILVIVSAIALLLLVLELVRSRRLREEYSWLWLLTAVGYFLVAVWPDLSGWVAQFIGSTNPVAAFAFLGLFFLVLISIQFSIQISRLTDQNKDLAQQIALLDSELRRLVNAFIGKGSPGQLPEEPSAQRADD